MKYISSRGKEKGLTFENILFAGCIPNIFYYIYHRCYETEQEWGLRTEEIKLIMNIVFIIGYSSDGGLYFPEAIPTLSTETINQWSSLGYIDLVKVNLYA